MTSIKAVFFDADDTVFTVYPSVTHHYQEALKRAQFKVEESALARALRNGWQSYLPLYENEENNYRCSIEADRDVWLRFTQSVLDEVLGSTPSPELVSEIYHSFSRATTRRVFDGFVDAITALKQRGIFIGLFTNNDMRTHSVLAEFGLTAHFDIILTAGEVGYKKPAPEAFTELLRRAGTTTHETLFVGDSIKHDYHGARRAGLHALLFGKKPGDAVLFEGEEVIHSFEHFSELLERLPK